MSQNLRVERTVKFISAFEEGYARYTRIPTVTVPKRFNPIEHKALRFSDIGVRETVPNEWFDSPNVSADMYFYDTGRAIAIGEDNHMLKQILKTLDKPTSEVKAPTEQTIMSTLHEMVKAFFKSSNKPSVPSVLFAPIKFMTPTMLGTMDYYRVVDGRDFIQIPQNITLEIFWSNNYTDFDDFILLSKQSFSEWVFKSPSENRLIIEMKAYSSDEQLLTAKTSINYAIKNKNAAIRFAII